MQPLPKSPAGLHLANSGAPVGNCQSGEMRISMGGELKLKSQICCDVSGQVMAMMIMMMRHLSVKSKGLVKSLEEPVANTEAAVGPRLAILSD